MAANFFKAPEWALDKEESTALAQAVKDVSDFYNFEASQEAILWTNLIAALAMVYGPRVFTTIQKRNKESKPKQAAPSIGAKVTPAPVSDSVSNSPSPTMPTDFDMAMLGHLGNASDE